MKLQFNAFIPGHLGRPLSMLALSYKKVSLKNENEFYQYLQRVGGSKTWIKEPASDNIYCATDSREFGEHNIAFGKEEHKSRLFLYPKKKFGNNIDLSSIGSMHQKYGNEVFQKLCDLSHRVRTHISYGMPDNSGLKHTYHYGGSRINLIPTNHQSCHYANPNYPLYGSIEVFEDKRSDPYDSWLKWYDWVVDYDENKSVIVVAAEAGYPYAEPFSPNIDFRLTIELMRLQNNYQVRIHGFHNQFPAYELLLDGVLTYKFMPASSGPGIYNLNAHQQFSVERSYPRVRQAMMRRASVLGY